MPDPRTTEQTYGASQLFQDVAAVLIALALAGALFDSWRLAVVAAVLLVLASLLAVVLLGLGQAAGRPYPERDR